MHHLLCGTDTFPAIGFRILFTSDEGTIEIIFPDSRPSLVRTLFWVRNSVVYIPPPIHYLGLHIMNNNNADVTLGYDLRNSRISPCCCVVGCACLNLDWLITITDIHGLFGVRRTRRCDRRSGCC